MPSSSKEFTDLWIWERVGDRLSWYLAVAQNAMPAKYLISGRVACEVSLSEASEEELWCEHDRKTGEFLELQDAIRRGEEELSRLPRTETSLVDLSVELAERMLKHCNFCRWNCQVDRTLGVKHGTCQLETASRVSSYFHHSGEELVFRGTRGSGTIFFTSCNMRCAFCQNSDISHDKENGLPVTPRQMAAIAWQLRMEGCHNINWVGGEPTIHLHNILEAISLLSRRKPSPEDLAHVQSAKSDSLFSLPWRTVNAYYGKKFNAPMLWNSNFFMSAEALRLLRPLTDIWLPDFKFGSNECALLLSRTPWYVETVSRNLKLVYEWGEDMLIRHLVMPNHVECCTRPILEWIAKNTPQALINIMDQYHPDYACNPYSQQFEEKYKELSRRVRAEEILEAYRYAEELGLRFEEVSLEKSAMGAQP